jgi:hypothetical protein
MDIKKRRIIGALRKARASKRLLRRTRRLAPPAYPSTPIGLAGRWVAWSPDREIVASGTTLSGVAAAVAMLDVNGVSYECLPEARDIRARR